VSRVISGWVVSRNREPGQSLPWRAWRSGELPLVADSYRGLLALIREAKS